MRELCRYLWELTQRSKCRKREARPGIGTERRVKSWIVLPTVQTGSGDQVGSAASFTIMDVISTWVFVGADQMEG